jgi:hypothetical protein
MQQVPLDQQESLSDHVLGTTNGEAVDTRNSSTNKQQLVIRLACGKHTAQMQYRSLVRSWQRAEAKQLQGVTALYARYAMYHVG